jgi:hypothetical protein
MEAIVLAISGLSLLAASAVLRRTGKHINTVQPHDSNTYRSVTSNPGQASAAIESRALLQKHVVPQLDRGTSAVPISRVRVPGNQAPCA